MSIDLFSTAEFCSLHFESQIIFAKLADYTSKFSTHNFFIYFNVVF